MATPIRGPVPPYSNPPIQPQYYQPSQFFISAITLGQTTTVTTSVNNNYVVGQEVRLIIPPSFGSRQLNGLSAVVIAQSTNQVILNLDSSRNVSPFIASSAATKAQILAIGDVNNGATNANGLTSQSTFIPGSFTNISPL